MIERITVASNGRHSPGRDLEDYPDIHTHTHVQSGYGPDSSPGPGPPLIPIPPPPRSPLKSVVRAYLPNEQRTTVQVKPGQTVQEALYKAMKLRKLSASMCAVYRCSQSEVRKQFIHHIKFLKRKH